MKLSVIIVNWNTCDLLRKCLFSLENLSKEMDSEVIVIDNASSDGSAAMACKEYSWAKLIENDKNIGFAAGNNIAFKRTRSTYTLILNPDTEVPVETVNSMVRYMDKNNSVGIVAPKLIGPDGKIQNYYYKLFSPIILITRFTFLNKIFPFKGIERSYLMHDNSFENSMEIEQASACCILVRNCVLREEYLMDERFPIFFNDVDLCKRMRDAKYKIFYLSDVSILHHGGQSLKLMGENYNVEYFGSALIYIRKHYGAGMQLLCSCVLFVLWTIFLPFLIVEFLTSPLKKAVKVKRKLLQYCVLWRRLIYG